MSTRVVSVNPFDEIVDEDEDAIKYVVTGPVKSVNPESSAVDDNSSIARADGVTLDSIASKLISEQLFLTALELHIELLESGREMAKLRDFFSNPANFERTGTLRSNVPGTVFSENSPPRLPRTSSIQTFDSLDFARSSDDGERNESDRIAVLEFELRKSHETIRSLRAALTRTAATEIQSDFEQSMATSVSTKIPLVDEPARPHERRALNFLVNEYLLRHDYKLTSVTFSEENANQDFDDWDDVGINVAKPPGLVFIYHEYGQARGGGQSLASETCDFSCMVEGSDFAASELQNIERELRSRISVLNNRIQTLEAENAALGTALQSLKTDADQPIYHYDTEHHHILQSTPTASPIYHNSAGLHLHTEVTELNITVSSETAEGWVNVDSTSEVMYETATEVISKEENKAASENLYPEMNSADDQPSFLSNSNTVQQESKLLSSTSSFGSHTTLSAFRQALLKAVFNILPDNRIFTEVSSIAEQNDTAFAEVVPMLARCLPHIVPNVLLAGRDELIPLIVCSAALHSDSQTRDQLLNVLFNLIKRPDADQRRMILVGCVAFARHAGASRVESELLPQCWEQITHKYVERRLLVAEACGALVPHVPAELRGSLIFSMLQQMLEDSNEEVREAAIRSFGVVVGFIEDADKYASVVSVFFAALGDVSERVAASVRQVFLPSLAVWSMELGRLDTGLISAFVGRIEKLISSSHPMPTAPSPAVAAGVIVGDQPQFCLLINTLSQLMQVLFASFLSSAPFSATVLAGDSTPKVGTPVLVLNSLPKPSSDLLDAGLILGDDEILTRLMQAYESYVDEEWYHPWNAYTWVSNELVSQLRSIAESLSASDQTVVHCLSAIFRNVCRTFGPKFTKTSIQPHLRKSVKFPAANALDMSLVEHASIVRCIAPVYAVGVLCAFAHDDNRKDLTQFLTEFIQVAALRKCNLVGVYATVTELCSIDELSSGIQDLLLSVLWDCVVHPSPLIRAAAARSFEPAIRAGGVAELQIGTRVVPALVTLAGDTIPEVRAATVDALGAVVECVTGRAILDKVYMQLQSLMDDPAYRNEITLSTTLIRALGRAGPAAEPRFREDFMLPRLTAIAVNNSSNFTDVNASRTEVALALFDAYNSVSCCFFGEQLVTEVLLPGLKCLLRDLQQISPDHAGVVASMIREFEDRVHAGSGVLQTPRMAVDASPVNGNVTAVGATAGDAIKSKMLSHIRDVKDRASYSNLNLSKIFTTAKK